MGQRHQFFIKVLNPVKRESFNSRLSPSRLKEARKMFGNAKHTILAFHNQWLYGRSAVVNILNVLHFTDQETMQSYNNPFNDEFSSYDDDAVNGYIKAVTQLISTQACKLHPRGIGIEGVHFLNEGDPDMRHYFNHGDNNDGITIIDTISRKYCMMNIYGQDDEANHGIYSAPQFKPLTCREYMKLYYGETENALNDYYTDGKSNKDIKDMINEHIEGNVELQIAVNEATNGILNSKELTKLFPKFYKEILVN